VGFELTNLNPIANQETDNRDYEDLTIENRCSFYWRLLYIILIIPCMIWSVIIFYLVIIL